MLKTNPKNSQNENLTVELFREALVDLLVEAASMKKDPDHYVMDEKVFDRFKSLLEQAKDNSGNALSDYYSIYKIVSDYSVSGTPILQLDKPKIKTVNKDELMDKLQNLYNSIKLFSASLTSPNSSLFLVS